MTTLSYSGMLVTTVCWCGIAHAVPQELYDYMERQHRDGLKQQGIFCPLGHSWTFAGEGEAERLRKELERQQRRLTATRDLLAAEERSHRATRGNLTKARKRAAAGVCPCCHRSIASDRMAAHMKTKHPDFNPEAMPDADVHA